MTWPANPPAWLSPPRTLAAFDAVVDAEGVGQVLPVGALDGSAEVSRLFVMPSRRGGGIGGPIIGRRSPGALRLAPVDCRGLEKRHTVSALLRATRLATDQPAALVWGAPDGSDPFVRRYVYSSRWPTTRGSIAESCAHDCQRQLNSGPGTDSVISGLICVRPRSGFACAAGRTSLGHTSVA